MDCLLDSRVNLHQLVINIRVVINHDLRIPSHRHEDGLNATTNGSHEDLADLKTNQESESHNDRGEVTIPVVRGVGELQIEIGQQRTDIGDESRTHSQHRTHQAVLHESINSSIAHHRPSILGCGDICLSVQCDVTERVAIEKRNEPVQQRDDRSQNPNENTADQVTLSSLLSLRDRARLPQHVDERDDQTAETDTAKGVCSRATEGAPGGALGHAAGGLAEEIPRTVDTSDGGVHRVLDPLTDPVHGEGHVDDEADDLCSAAAAVRAGWVVASGIGLVGDVDRDHRDGEPGGESDRYDSAQRADYEDVPVPSGHVHGGLQHKGSEWDSRDPANETDDCEDAEDEEHDTTSILLARDVIDSCCQGEDNVENAGRPDEGLGEVSCAHEIEPRED